MHDRIFVHSISPCGQHYLIDPQRGGDFAAFAPKELHVGLVEDFGLAAIEGAESDEHLPIVPGALDDASLIRHLLQMLARATAEAPSRADARLQRRVYNLLEELGE